MSLVFMHMENTKIPTCRRRPPVACGARIVLALQRVASRRRGALAGARDPTRAVDGDRRGRLPHGVILVNMHIG
jgi:hypothetical protein